MIIDSFFWASTLLLLDLISLSVLWVALGVCSLFHLSKTVLLSVCPQDPSESSSSAPATQFIMLPLPAYSVVENPTSIKLVSVWGADGD